MREKEGGGERARKQERERESKPEREGEREREKRNASERESEREKAGCVGGRERGTGAYSTLSTQRQG